MRGGVAGNGVAAEASSGFLDRFFSLSAKGTNVRTEAIAGATTFLTMAYIIFVNPSILAQAGMDREGLVVVTCLSSAIMCIWMGLWANLPIALAPGMGLNAFFTYTLVLTMGLSWQQALGVVFVSGCITVVLTFTNVREIIVYAIPPVLKKATATGIGLFIAFLGFKSIGLITTHPATYLTITHHWPPELLLSLLGVALMGVLIIRRVKGAILLGILVVTVLGIGLRLVGYSLHYRDLAGRPMLSALAGGPLQELGLHRDDVILSVGGREVGSLADLGALPPADQLSAAPGPPAAAEVAPGTIAGSNPPGHADPAGAVTPAGTVAVRVARASVLGGRSEISLAARPDQVEVLRAESQSPAGRLVPVSASAFASLPQGVFSAPRNLDKSLFQLSLSGIFSAVFLSIILSYVFVDLFDTIGTLIAVGYKAGLTDKDGNLPQIRQALQVDAFAAVVGSVLGTSSVTSYIESAAGVEEGGKTGLTAVFCGLLFLLAMFLVPLVGAVPPYAISPCLIIVGLAMLDHIGSIDFANFEDGLPAFLTILLMPLAHNISIGLGFGFLSYVVIKLALGKSREVHWMLYIICALFILNLAAGGV